MSATLGYRNVRKDRDITLSDIGTHDFGYVLGNGFDTMVELNFEGTFLGHKALSQEFDPAIWAPFRQVQIAEWTTRGSTAVDKRVAMTLNRLGEILIYRGGQLLFARRSGIWHFLTHAPVIRQMSPPKHPHVRAAVYQTCLDASFARTGACIGVVDNRNSSDLHKLVNVDDFIADGNSIKSKTLRRAIAGKRFQELDRALRQELVAIDGATLLSRQGLILAIGAILSIPSGSSGGGRRAAAVELSKLGLGIKVSQDGSISGFRAGDDTPSFRIM